MIIDMNNDTSLNTECVAYPDFPSTPPARLPVREEVILQGSTTANRTLVLRGTADQYEPPRR